MILFPRSRQLAYTKYSPCLLLIHISVLLGVLVTRGHGMTDDAISTLRQETRDLFYHGYLNYLAHAFPEDELKPLSCQPQVRNRDNPADIGLNDVLGNYSLTLIDSLSTLALLASGKEDGNDGHYALQDFQIGVQALVELYGDGKGECGQRACGFDLDSKVQVFETNIRGVGGLLSAHLFAVGELPIRGYEPDWTDTRNRKRGIKWPGGFVYTSQLLDLAHDLASRLLPAFNNPTGLPYPRVNLRTGIPFYQDAEQGFCRVDGTSTTPREITETCAAGAGSLVLEFSVLSRLTGDRRFERLAKKAFWAVWERRSSIGLIGNGLDAESGEWTVPPLAGIGAGIDSFYEYALKSHILLSSASDTSDSDAFLAAWNQSHAAIHHHIRRSGFTEKHPYYGQSDLATGAPRFNWIDNLSAYFPGLLTLAGEVDEAIEAHLLFAALWTRYSALPERWNAPIHPLLPSGSGIIDPNFKHWAGRPEFIESTYYLYLATKDPWYLHVGEMVLRDIRRRCWTPCGWAALADVVNGEQRDRMESFFLGETAKYLYLLFSAAGGGHALDGLRDQGWVFSTEGHPLLIPKWALSSKSKRVVGRSNVEAGTMQQPLTCLASLTPLPLTVSNVANRADLFHAAALAQLHLVPINPSRSSPLLPASSSGPGISYSDVRSPTNYTFYPWTLPYSLIPAKGLSSPISNPTVSTLTFPDLSPPTSIEGKGSKPTVPAGALQKVLDGVLVNSLSNVRLSMVQIPLQTFNFAREAVLNPSKPRSNVEYRIETIANWALGRDEKVLISEQAMKPINPTDPHFTKVKDLEKIFLVVDLPADDDGKGKIFEVGAGQNATAEDSIWDDLEAKLLDLLSGAGLGRGNDEGKQAVSLKSHGRGEQPGLTRLLIPAILPTGLGAAPLPATMDIADSAFALGALPYKSVYFLNSTLCTLTLPLSVAKENKILVIRRGGCSFNDKLSNIPSFAPESRSLELVIVISHPEDTKEETLIRPLLDTIQRTPSGLLRHHALAMCMVDGSKETVEALKRVATGYGEVGQDGKLAEQKVDYVGGAAGKGLAVKRRYWFESLGVPIGNLILL